MALTLNDTVGDADANSYANLVFSDDYWDNHYSTVKRDQWRALNDDQKVTALIHACRVIETARYTVQRPPESNPRLIYNRVSGLVAPVNTSLIPVKHTSTQKLQFPRNIDVDAADVPFIPEDAKTAQCEQALYLLTYDDSAVANRLRGVVQDALAVGNIKTQQTFVTGGSAFSPVALEMVRNYMIKPTATMRRA